MCYLLSCPKLLKLYNLGNYLFISLTEQTTPIVINLNLFDSVVHCCTMFTRSNILVDKYTDIIKLPANVELISITTRCKYTHSNCQQRYEQSHQLLKHLLTQVQRGVFSSVTDDTQYHPYIPRQLTY